MPDRRRRRHRCRPPAVHAIAAALALAVFLLSSLAVHAQKRGAEQLTRPTVPAKSKPAGTPDTTPSSAPIQIRIGPHAGWPRCVTIGNGTVEALVVPDIGRVMQFRFTGQPGPFWEDPALRGRTPDPKSSDWGNFGGDKTWPAPQADWDKVTPRSWPPPPAFDSMPVEVTVRRDTLVLTSPVDPYYGIRTERVLALHPKSPVMTLTTRYEKVSGPPVKTGVWIITQLEDPVGVFSPIPPRSLFESGYNRQSGDILPANLEVDRGLLSLTRDPARATKIGLDSDRLLWVGRTHMLLIESPRKRGVEYPDQQSSAEIYTNPDPKTYVELEMLGPLSTLNPGDQIEQVNTYTLLPRQSDRPHTDARQALGLAP
jgi:hypothetical protein